MSCYHPMLGIWTGERTEKGAKKYKFLKVPERYGKEGFKYPANCIEHMLIPCGQCIGCRLDKSRQWADRMMLELETSGNAVFVTLTYEEEALDPDKKKKYGKNEDLTCEAMYTYFDDEKQYATLSKVDAQKWMKRLRKEFEGREIRFYLCGEYGSKTLRPHLHAILFGVGLRDLCTLYEIGNPIGKNGNGDKYYISARLRKTWPYGNNLVTNVSYETMAYVARYVTKKLNGDLMIEYARRNVIPEFSLMSRKPGIGRKYLDLHPSCLDMETLSFFDGKEAKKIRIPKYYLSQMKFVPKVKGEDTPEANYFYDPEKYDEKIKKRIEFSEDRVFLELKKTDKDFEEYLADNEKKRKEILAGKNKKCYNINAREPLQKGV